MKKSLTLREFIEDASRKIELIFNLRGVIYPMLHFIDRDGQEHITDAPPTNDKDMASAIIRAALELYGATRFLFIDEAWTAHAEGPEKAAELLAYARAHGGKLEGYPQRIEVVIFNAEDASEGGLMAQRVIDRSGRKPKLGPLIMHDWTESEGRLVGMLPRKGMMQ